MPDIAPFIAPIQQSAKPANTPSKSKGSESSFQSILETTTASQQQQTSTQTTQKSNSVEDTKITGSTQGKDSASDTAETFPAQETGQDNNVLIATGTNPNTQNEAIHSSELQKAIELQAFTRVFLTGANDSSGPFPEKINIPFGLVEQSALNTGIKSDQSLLSAELEQLITLHEKGVVSIVRQDGSKVSLADLQNLQGAQLNTDNLATKNDTLATTLSDSTTGAGTKNLLINGVNGDQLAAGKLAEDPAVKSGLERVIVVEDEVPVVLRNNDNQSTHLRQDVKGQYIEAKIEANTTSQSGSGNTSNQQTSQQDVSSNAQTQNTQTTLATTTSDTSPSYSQVSQGVLDTSLAKTASAQNPTSPFPGSTVSDEAIIQQVTQKFNLHVRNQETQINIKLQPAELGELKIDLTYREGAIRANVFAQSQHAHEVLEKNMPRLREILQGQGIQVEDIQIASKPDITEDLDLLNEQLGNRENYQQPNHNHIDKENFNEILEAVGVQSQTESTGVNVTV